MPTYTYRCANRHQFDRFLTVKDHEEAVSCQSCDLVALQVIGAPLLVKAAADVCYDSPVDGAPITSWDKRREDLKRTGCIPYDPAMKQDYERRIAESETIMDRSIEAHVEEAIEKMPTAKRAELHKELIEKSATLEITRESPH